MVLEFSVDKILSKRIFVAPLKEEKVESSSMSFEQELSTKPDLPSYIGGSDQNSASGNFSCGIFLPYARFDVRKA